MCDHRLFTPQIDALGGGRAIHLAPMSGGDSTAALAEGVLAHAPPRFALAGLSMGGIVAMEVSARAPERVDRLALLDTNPLAESPGMAARRGPQIDSVLRGNLREVMRDEMKPNYLAETPRKDGILDLCMVMAMALGPEVFVAQSKALRARPDRRDTLRSLNCPALVLCGRHDRLCPLERHEMMRDLIPGARLEVIEDAGHMPTLEQPERTTAALGRWLKEE